jgi:hypothetical protein
MPKRGHFTPTNLRCTQGRPDLSRNSFGIFTERFYTNALRKIRVIGLLLLIQNESRPTRRRVNHAVRIALNRKIGTMCEHIIDGWGKSEAC